MTAQDHFDINDWETYAFMRDAVAEYKFWRGSRASVKTDEVPTCLRHVDNRMRSAVETFEFQHCGNPSKYFAYVKLATPEQQAALPPRIAAQGHQAIITTWTGQFLGTAVLGAPYKSPAFGGYSTRQSIEVLARNGALYHGTYYRSSGDYCRLKMFIKKASSRAA